MSTYELFVTLHVVAAVAWVGGGTVSALLAAKVSKSDNQPVVADFTHNMAVLGKIFFGPVSMLTVIFGAIAVSLSGSPGFADPWVSAGLTMFVISALIGMTFLGPQSEKLHEAIEAGGFGSAAYTSRLNRLLIAGRVELFLLYVIVVLMVIKPG